jgi:hypothetical protein
MRQPDKMTKGGLLVSLLVALSSKRPGTTVGAPA